MANSNPYSIEIKLKSCLRLIPSQSPSTSTENKMLKHRQLFRNRSSSTKKFYCLKPFRHTLDDYLQEFVTTRQAKQATKWNIVSYSWLQRHDQLLPLAHSRRFWHDRHIVSDPPTPPAHDQCIREYFNACYTQLQHQVTFASSQQPFESDFTRALLKHGIGNPQTTDDSERDDTFWPSIQEEIQYMMLHTSRERYNKDYEPVLLTRSQAYVERSSDAVVLHPIIPYDLSKISIVEFSNCVCFTTSAHTFSTTNSASTALNPNFAYNLPPTYNYYPYKTNPGAGWTTTSAFIDPTPAGNVCPPWNKAAAAASIWTLGQLHGRPHRCPILRSRMPRTCAALQNAASKTAAPFAAAAAAANKRKQPRANTQSSTAAANANKQ
eukprot:gene21238-23313_t